MRTIIFRGKRKDNGKWVEGNFYESQISGCYILENKLLATVGGRHSRATIRDKLIPYEVDPETVSQYTGLKDKNGKRIFEGDIIRSRYDSFDLDYVVVGVVKWFRNGWAIQERDCMPYSFTEDGILPYTEVVDNIHDNQELLKGGNE